MKILYSIFIVSLSFSSLHAKEKIIDVTKDSQPEKMIVHVSTVSRDNIISVWISLPQEARVLLHALDGDNTIVSATLKMEKSWEKESWSTSFVIKRQLAIGSKVVISQIKLDSDKSLIPRQYHINLGSYILDE